jgi:ribosomal protein S6
MAAKKKPSAAQLAARAKFVAMVRAKSKAKKSATKKATVKKAAPKKAAKKKVVKKKVSGLEKVVRRGSKTNVHYSRISGIDANSYAINEIERLTRYNDELKRFIENSKDKLKNDKSLSNFNKGVLKISISRLRYLLSDNKKRIIQLKKHIK